MGKYTEAWERYGTQEKAAAALGIGQRSFERGLKRERSGTPEPPKPPPANKLNLSGISEQAAPTSTAFTRVLYFTDAHNQPGMSLERFKWLAALVNDQKPDILADGGDGDDYHSLCSHERNETYKGRLKPLLHADLEAAANMRAMLRKEIKHPCRKIITLGNHEHRLWTYEDQNPAMYGIVTAMYTEILEATGWEWYPYGAYVDIAGVNFTHVPFNVMGKPVGGETACKQIADKSVKDTVWGHTHVLDQWSSQKFGTSVSVKAFNGGSFMPSGYIPSYVKNTKKEFWYGCHLISIKNGRIAAIKSWHMDELEETYGG